MKTTPTPEARSKFAGLYVQRRPPSRADTLYRAYLAALALAHRTRGAGAQAHYHRADRYLDAFERARAAERTLLTSQFNAYCMGQLHGAAS